MSPQPLYTPQNVNNPAYHLRFAWTAWPSRERFPPRPSDDFWQPLDEAWETDGLRRLEGTWTEESIQITFSVKPIVSPILCVARAKGRLQYALRNHGTPVTFSRKVAFRTIGDNCCEEVERYVANQIVNEQFVDVRFAERLQGVAYSDSAVHLEQSTETNSGRYWYNLHLVLVADDRLPARDSKTLNTLRDGSLRIAAARGHRIRELSVMPDHMHLALRGNVETSPGEIALQFMNNLAYLLGRKTYFRFGYYVGSFGEYSMRAVRQHT
jgi:REP element-mobilizing transposase RayT